ncbi:DUF1810 domain-containing protein [Roseovarius sp. PS-C2]|uniref:DUF1810 domain-containing protein n=1 Tax=Roseovarius sp. PS-C2 TaxID=2820814 RepID=UPI001C0C2255|nr:DUF1810 domain-containing protein [Roseovarius sp. PS-C2]MBU3261384.1 DUF1810 domain-containing protein [Roseovarius sp. PS-C2]
MSLERFTDAQARVWPRPLEEIRAGRKTSHWMWYVFPQLCGLGHSPTAQHYGIADLDEARAYLAHPVLGSRLSEISRAMLDHSGTPPEAILGPVDALKLRSCATLFAAAGNDPVFEQILDGFYDGNPCEATLAMLG